MKIIAIDNHTRKIELDSVEVRKALELWLFIELNWRMGDDWKFEVPEMEPIEAFAKDATAETLRRMHI